MKFSILLYLFLIITNSIFCQKNENNNFPKAYSYMYERINEIEKEGFQIIAFEINNQNTNFEVSSLEIKSGDSLFAEATIICNKQTNFSPQAGDFSISKKDYNKMTSEYSNKSLVAGKNSLSLYVDKSLSKNTRWKLSFIVKDFKYDFPIETRYIFSLNSMMIATADRGFVPAGYRDDFNLYCYIVYKK